MSQKYEMQGTIKAIKDVQTFRNDFKKREFVLELPSSGSFTDVVSFVTMKDNIAKLDRVQVGQEVKVTFIIRGHEWNDRVFNDLVAWEIDPVGEPVFQQDAPVSPVPPSAAVEAEPADDDIPF